MLIALFLFLIVILAGIAIWHHQLSWLPDLALLAVIVIAPGKSAWLLFGGLAAVVRRWPRPLAIDLAQRRPLVWLPDHLLAVAMPGAVEYKMLDTLPVPAGESALPPPRLMSRQRAAAARTYDRAKHGRVITKLQERNAQIRRRNARNNVPAGTKVSGTPATGKTITIRESEQIAAWLAMDMSEDWIVKHLDGYSGRKYQAYLAKVRAVKEALAQQSP